MAAKRQAVSDLNHDNWDKEEEPEDPGKFREASDEELKNRVIKKARRRITGENDSSSSTTKSIFSGFSGFTPAPATKASPFSFLSKLPTTSSSAISSNTTTNTSSVSTITSTSSSIFSFGNEAADNSDTKSKTDDVYFSKIMKLNKSFCDWIVKHVDEQPICDLTPTFRDYEKFLKEIEQESKKGESVPKPLTTLPSTSQAVVTAATSTALSASVYTNFKYSPTTSPAKPAAPVTSSLETSKSKSLDNSKDESIKANGGSSFTPLSTRFNVGQTNTDGGASQKDATSVASSTKFSFGGTLTTQAKSDTSTPFSFGLKADSKSPPTSGFSFGLKKPDEASSSTGFSFMPGGTPFTFGNIKPPAAEPQKENCEDEEDEPPKVEVKEIVEEDAFYTKRCKVFVKKDNAYKDHGVGTFYLKPVKESEKTQLLVRSGNNLGTILVNVILVEGMPTQRMGKNNVMLVHPCSSEENKPQTTLFRVKDGAEADELLEMINTHKK